jgi:hypothetical protein
MMVSCYTCIALSVYGGKVATPTVVNIEEEGDEMSRRKITAFYAWQSDRPSKINKDFIRKALDAAARRITDDPKVDVDLVIDSDTEGVVGTPPVTETILRKIATADIFVPDLTLVARTEPGKLTPNPNVMVEYGYALRALTFEAMMPVMNTYFGEPEELPFDLGHVRHPLQYRADPSLSDDNRRALREKLSTRLEEILRLMVPNALDRSRSETLFKPFEAKRPPAFFFTPEEVLIKFGYEHEQELRFKRDRAIYIRLYPKHSDQPRVGLARAIAVASKLSPPQRLVSSPSGRNDWGAVNVEPQGDGIMSLTQIFTSGELWGLSEEPFQSNKPELVPAIRAEKGYVAALDNYRLVYERELKMRPPFVVEFGATGLKGCHLLVPSVEFPSLGQDAGAINRDSISHQTEIQGFDPAEWREALRGYLMDFYDLAAVDRTKVLTDRHVAANDLAPL